MTKRLDDELRSLGGKESANGVAVELAPGKSLASHQLPGQASPETTSERPDGAVATGGATVQGGAANVSEPKKD